MKGDPKAPPIRDKTDVGNLVRAYVETFPRYIGGYEESRRYGFKFHTQSQRSGDCTRRGYPVTGRTRDGEEYSEYRLKDYPTFVKAWKLVQSWRLGIPVEQVDDLGLIPPVFMGEVGDDGQIRLDLTGLSGTSPHSVVSTDGRLL